MKYYMDFAYGSLIKHGEELCGDMVEFFNDENQFVAVLSDRCSVHVTCEDN